MTVAQILRRGHQEAKGSLEVSLGPAESQSLTQPWTTCAPCYPTASTEMLTASKSPIALSPWGSSTALPDGRLVGHRLLGGLQTALETCN